MFNTKIIAKIKKERSENMRKRIGLWAAAFLGVFFITGCATGRSYQSDIDALNTKIAAMQSQLSGKDEEISKLQSQVRDEQAARAQAEAEKRAFSDKLDSMSSGPSKTGSDIPDSDLK